MDREQSKAVLTQLVAHAFETMTQDLTRARAILHEAVPKLISSFHGLRTNLSTQSSELQAVTKQLKGDGQQLGFLATMRNVLETFVSDLVRVSHNSMQLVDRVELLSTDVDQIVGHVSHIETLSKTTRLIALNARIEAHRAGEWGKTFRVVADEVKALSDDANEFSGQIREIVEQALARLGEAREAVTALASHDLNSLLQAQQNVLDTIERVNETNTRVFNSIETINAHVDGAIRALQFEDILDQLLASIGNRLGLAGELWRTWLAANVVDSSEAWASLDELTKRLGPELERRAAVQQKSMETGTAELF